jgi:type II secretory pathway component PulJ
MRIQARSGSQAFLLQEVMISLSIFSAISLALIMGFVSLERNFAATTDFATNHSDSVRISDYLARDLRRALSVTSASNDVTLTVPAYYDADGNPQTPQIDGEGDVYYGTSGSVVTVRYYLSGSTIYRQENNGIPVGIAENVKDFNFTVTDLGKVATTRITFNPIFLSGGASGDSIAGTAIYNTILLRNGSGVYN